MVAEMREGEFVWVLLGFSALPPPKKNPYFVFYASGLGWYAWISIGLVGESFGGKFEKMGGKVVKKRIMRMKKKRKYGEGEGRES